MSFNYPIFLDLAGKDILVIGAGKAAAEKIPRLLQSECKLTVIAEAINEKVSDMLLKTETTLINRKAKMSDIDGRFMVFFCADDKEASAEFREYAAKRKILFNSADDPHNCDFYTCAAVDRGTVTLAISTQGKYAGFAAMLRRLIDTLLPADSVEDLEKLFEARIHLIQSQKNSEIRRAALKKAIEIIEASYHKYDQA